MNEDMLVASDTDEGRLDSLKDDLESCFKKLQIYGRITFYKTKSENGNFFNLYAHSEFNYREMFGFFLGFVWGRQGKICLNG